MRHSPRLTLLLLRWPVTTLKGSGVRHCSAAASHPPPHSHLPLLVRAWWLDTDQPNAATNPAPSRLHLPRTLLLRVLSNGKPHFSDGMAPLDLAPQHPPLPPPPRPPLLLPLFQDRIPLPAIRAHRPCRPPRLVKGSHLISVSHLVSVCHSVGLLHVVMSVCPIKMALPVSDPIRWGGRLVCSPGVTATMTASCWKLRACWGLQRGLLGAPRLCRTHQLQPGAQSAVWTGRQAVHPPWLTGAPAPVAGPSRSPSLKPPASPLEAATGPAVSGTREQPASLGVPVATAAAGGQLTWVVMRRWT
mmetsp:Transcript_11529/g.34605  ORF Transcript_11529/g.34605 Transcript_11529/m.34605 type:complete len:302 (+) Transcript_11529:687-1592(+)